MLLYNPKLLEGTMFPFWTKIREKPFMKECTWKTFIIKSDQEIPETVTKNKEIFVQT